MKLGKIFTILGLSVAMISGSMTAYAQEKHVAIITVGYDSETSLATLTTTEKGGTLLYAYKIGTTKDNVNYPVYDKDKIYTFDEKGAYIGTSTGNLDKPIFTDDPASWLDYSKITPDVAQDSDYYTYFLQADGVLQLPYSAESTGQCYIPIEGQEKYITILAVYKSSDGTYSDVVSKDFAFGKEEVEGLKITVTSISKDKDTEIIKVSASSLNRVDYIQCTYDDEIHRIEKESGSVKYKITDNGTYTIFAYEKDNLIPEVSTYTVSGLSEKNNLGDIDIEKEVNDSKAPVIKVSVPKSATDGKVTVKISTNEKSDINFNGSSYLGVSKAEAVITADGVYKVTAIDESGNLSEKSFTVNCFENSEGWNLDKDTYWNGRGDTDYPDTEPKTGDSSSTMAIVIVVIYILTAIGTAVLILLRKKKQS
jgi:LPXTG-motif cell wall-anchored protein